MSAPASVPMAHNTPQSERPSKQDVVFDRWVRVDELTLWERRALGPILYDIFCESYGQVDYDTVCEEIIFRPGGELVLSGPCFQEVAASGAWTRTASADAGEVTAQDDDALAGALEVAGRALADAGYHGPFGIDAFRYRDGAGATRLNPLGELNARFTMDWRPAMQGALARLDRRTP